MPDTSLTTNPAAAPVHSSSSADLPLSDSNNPQAQDPTATLSRTSLPPAAASVAPVPHQRLPTASASTASASTTNVSSGVSSENFEDNQQPRDQRDSTHTRRLSRRIANLSRNPSGRGLFSPLPSIRRSRSASHSTESLGQQDISAADTQLRARGNPESLVARSEELLPLTRKDPIPEGLSQIESTPGAPFEKPSDVAFNTAWHERGDLAPSAAALQQNSTVYPSAVVKTPKMHQTSSRLLRMTDDERPYTSVSRGLFNCFRGGCLSSLLRCQHSSRMPTPPKPVTFHVIFLLLLPQPTTSPNLPLPAIYHFL